MYACVYVCMCNMYGCSVYMSCVYACTYVSMYACTYVFMYICLYVCTCVCMYVCMYVCVICMDVLCTCHVCMHVHM